MSSETFYRSRALNSRRNMIQMLGGIAAGTSFASSVLAQGRCRDGYETRQCPLTAELATAPIKPIFASTGWKTMALDHIAYQVPDCEKEAAFYVALMGWKLRSIGSGQAVLDIGDWGSAVFKNASEKQAHVQSFCFVIEPWDARIVEGELRKRGLNPVADNNGKGFESFQIKDPDGFSLQIGNGNGHARERKTTPGAKLGAQGPLEATGWKTVWLDHFSYNAANYKQSASFYTNLLGWKETYDEGSQQELMIGDVGDIIIRGGNPNNPAFGTPGAPPTRRERIDHISFGISPWNTDGVKSELEKRGLRARIDTSTRDDIHVAAFKSYHTTTPNGYDLQISYVTHDNRLALPNAVKPKG